MLIIQYLCLEGRYPPTEHPDQPAITELSAHISAALEKWEISFSAFECVCRQFGPFSSSVLDEDAQLKGEAMGTHGEPLHIFVFLSCSQFLDISIICTGGRGGCVCTHTHICE